MIAVLIGVLLLTGIIYIFEVSLMSNKSQAGLARIQENGRFALMEIKQNIEQAGYQYCMSSGGEQRDRSTGTVQRPWRVYSYGSVFKGVPNNPDKYFDTANLIHGHECSELSCVPNFDSLGTDKSYVVPDIGTSQGNRLAGTDVLTVRYLSRQGYEVEKINGSKIKLTQNSIDNLSGALERILVASCNDLPPYVLDVNSINNGVIEFDTSNISITDPTPLSEAGSVLTRVFDMDNDVLTVTYYVGINIVDNRSIPTLYIVKNGVVGVLIEGVDRFDVLYGLSTKNGLSKNITYLTADQVGSFVDCKPIPNDSYDSSASQVNGLGCGWRSVDFIEVHMLINSVYNSSKRNNEPFLYSIDGTDLQDPNSLLSGIDHYNLHRKEFFLSIALKNAQD